MIVQTIMKIMFIGVVVQAGKISFNTFCKVHLPKADLIN